MELVFLIIAIVGLIVALIVGFLQLIVPFVKREVKFSKKFPFVINATEVATTKVDAETYAKMIAREFPIPKERKPIAVMPFKNLTGDSSFDYLSEAIPNLLITNLEQSEYLSVMTWERMHDLLEILGKEEMKIIDDKLGFEVCRLDGVNNIVLGSYTKAGEVFATDLKVLDVSTKKLLKTANSKAKGIDSILVFQIDELSKHIAHGVGIADRKIDKSKLRITDATTSSIDAYNYFLKGRENCEIGYYDDARKFLEKAVEIDSTFASAYLNLAWVYAWLLDNNKSYRALEKAKAFSEKVTEKEKLYIQATDAFYIEKNQEKRLRILEQLTTKYPKEKQGHLLLGNYYSYWSSSDRAIDEYNKALELDPNYRLVLCKLAYVYSNISDYPNALEYFKRYAAISPGHADPFDAMGDFYFGMGQLDKAIAQYKEALSVKPDFYISSGKIAYIYALQENYDEAMKFVDHLISKAPSSGIEAAGYCQKAFYNCILGNLNQSLKNLNTTEDLLELTEWKFGSAWASFLKAYIFYGQGKFALSQDFLKNCIVNLPNLPYATVFHNFYSGLIEVKQEVFDSAEARLASIKHLLPDINNTQFANHAQLLHDLLYAEVLLAQDSPEKSIMIIEKTSKFNVQWPPGPPTLTLDAVHIPFNHDVAARAYHKKGNIDRAIIEYERLIDPDPNKRGRCLILPLWHYELAKLYEEKALNAKAITEYEKFLKLWKDADKDLPEPHDARKRLANLKTN
jgi:tetratricopeptide (TPR) repeat protein